MKSNYGDKLHDRYLRFLNWFYPKLCQSCAEDLAYNEPGQICPSCREAISPVSEPICIVCGIHMPDGGRHCYDCKRTQIYFFCVRSFGIFEGPLRNLIHKLKYEGKENLSRDLSSYLFEAWKRYPELKECQVIIPVPLHPSSFRERGYNQADLLAQELLKRMRQGLTKNEKIPELTKNTLGRAKKTRSQTHLSKEERAQNVKSAFQVKDDGKVRGQKVLLIDDVSTTCSTLNECARTLRKSGAKKVFGLTLARD